MERLEDLWLLTKLQQERKAAQEAASVATTRAAAATGSLSSFQQQQQNDERAVPGESGGNSLNSTRTGMDVSVIYDLD